MGVDKGYGSGYKNSGKSKASALKPSRLKKTAPAVAKARTLKERTAAASPSTARDKYNPKTVKALKRGASDLANAVLGKQEYVNGQPVLESGVSGWKTIAAAIGKMAVKTGSDDAFRALSTAAKLAANGNKQAQRRILSIANRSVASFDIELSRGVAAGAKAPEYRTIANMGRTGLRVYERGLAKIFGEAGRAEPGFRAMGKVARTASQERYLENTFPSGMRNGYTYDRYAGTPTHRLPDGSIKLKNTKIDEYGNTFPRPGFKRMVRRGGP